MISQVICDHSVGNTLIGPLQMLTCKCKCNFSQSKFFKGLRYEAVYSSRYLGQFKQRLCTCSVRLPLIGMGNLSSGPIVEKHFTSSITRLVSFKNKSRGGK